MSKLSKEQQQFLRSLCGQIDDDTHAQMLEVFGDELDFTSSCRYELDYTEQRAKLTISVANTEEGATWLHDMVAIRISHSGTFLSDVFRRRRKSGTFTPRLRREE